MSDEEKKVEVRFGAFACTIEGYDNPVEQLREVLGLMQQMIADTPQLATTGDGFDPQPIQKALDEDDGPGIVVIRNEAAAPKDVDPADESVDDAEPSETAERPSAEDADEPEQAEVTLREADDDDADTKDDASGDSSLSTGVSAAAAAAAAYMGFQARTETDRKPGFVTATATTDTTVGDAGDITAEVSGAVADAADSATSGAEDAVAALTETGSDLADGLDGEAADDIGDLMDTAGEEATALATGAQEGASDIADAIEERASTLTDTAAAGLDKTLEQADTTLETAGETVSEATGALSGMAEDAGDALTESVQDTVDAATAKAEDAVDAVSKPLNIFAAPSEPEESEATVEPEPEDGPGEEPASLATVADDMPEPEAVPVSDVAESAPENIFTAPKEQPGDSSIVNIFAAPAAAAAGAVASMFSKGSTAREEQPTDEDVPDTVEPQADDAPVDEPTMDAAEAPGVVEEAEPAPLSSIFAPPPDAGKVRDLGSMVSDDTYASGYDHAAQPLPPEPEPEPEPEPLALGPEHRVPGEADPGPKPLYASVEDTAEPTQPVRSIFASPPPAEPVEAPLDDDQPESVGAFRKPEPPATDLDAEPAPDSSNRFQQLVSLVHGATTMGAPGEGGPSGPSEPDNAAPEPPLEEPSDLIDADHIARISHSETVADQLAAASAWLTLVKGQARFTRREVMTVLETIPTDKPRELADRIKGFGKLVRSGVLVLIDDGVFAMAQNDRERFQSLLDRN